MWIQATLTLKATGGWNKISPAAGIVLCCLTRNTIAMIIRSSKAFQPVPLDAMRLPQMISWLSIAQNDTHCLPHSLNHALQTRRSIYGVISYNLVALSSVSPCVPWGRQMTVGLKRTMCDDFLRYVYQSIIKRPSIDLIIDSARCSTSLSKSPRTAKPIVFCPLCRAMKFYLPFVHRLVIRCLMLNTGKGHTDGHGQ
jgi:hypothetical protein